MIAPCSLLSGAHGGVSTMPRALLRAVNAPKLGNQKSQWNGLILLKL
jgi:hypothetical protein